MTPPPEPATGTAEDAGPAPLRDSPKSLRTRARILEAAIALIGREGYAAAGNAAVAAAAGLTRGAMLYHFPDRESLAAAVAARLHGRRIALLDNAARSQAPGIDATDHAIDSYWRLLHDPAFVAWRELESAARTDAVLAGILQADQAEFDRAQFRLLQGGDNQLSALMQAGAGPRFQASRDLARFLLEGLAAARLTYDAPERQRAMLAVLKRAVHAMNRKRPTDLWTD